MLTGNWRNFDELEESLTLPELEAMVKAKRKYDHEQHRFMAALKGFKLDDPEQTTENDFERIKREAQAARLGKTVEEMDINEAGFGYTELK